MTVRKQNRNIGPADQGMEDASFEREKRNYNFRFAFWDAKPWIYT
jgi:hypothetical protein